MPKHRPREGSHSSRRGIAPCAQAANPGLSRRNATTRLRRRETPMRPCSGWGLPCGPRCRSPGALLPHPFTLACEVALHRRYTLCGTFPRFRSCGFPWPLTGRALPATLVSWSPDFPRIRRHAAARPPGALYLVRVPPFGKRHPVTRVNLYRPRYSRDFHRAREGNARSARRGWPRPAVRSRTATADRRHRSAHRMRLPSNVPD